MGGVSSMGKVLGAAFVTLLVCSPPRPSCACSCAPDSVERLDLEIDSVTQDGAPVTDLSPWRGWRFEIAAYRGYVIVTGDNNDISERRFFSRHYAPVR